MAKKRGKKNSSAACPGTHGITLREENIGRKHVNPQVMLRLQHLQRLATWAGGEASIPALAAHYGRLLAADAELEGVPLDPSVLACQRCETILQPGYNCTIRIEKNASGTRHNRKSGIPKNNVVYACHFCSHRNQRKGATKGQIKELFVSRSISESNLAESMITTVGKSDKDARVPNDLEGYNEHVNGSNTVDVKGSPEKKVARDILASDSPKTPADKVAVKKMKISGPGSSKDAKTGSSYATTGSWKDSSISSKRRRKGWSGLREITLSNEHEKVWRMNNLTIPFLM